MSVRVGCTLLPWAARPMEEGLEAVERAGYEGVEVGVLLASHRGPLSALRNLLEQFGLVPLSGEYAAWFFDRGRAKEELEGLRRMLDLLADLGCEVIVLQAAVIQERLRVAGQLASTAEAWLTRDQLRYMAEMLNRAGDISRDAGLSAVFRHRAGSLVETRAELELIAEHTEPELVGLALDAAHLVYGGVGPDVLPAVVRAYAHRISYWPVQDLRLAMVERVRAQQLAFAAVEGGAFVEPGEGDLDLASLARPLRAARFSGWVVSALERPSRTPADSARAVREFIGEKLGW